MGSVQMRSVSLRSDPAPADEFRNEVMLQFVDYIDRLIIGAFKPLAAVVGPSATLPKEPRVRAVGSETSGGSGSQ